MMKKWLKSVLAGAFVATLMVATNGSAKAAQLFLSDLLKSGASITVTDPGGTKVFSKFKVVSNIATGGALKVNPKFVAVTPLSGVETGDSGDNGEPVGGLVFSSGSEFDVGAGQSQDFHFTYDVKYTPTKVTSYIEEAVLEFTGAATPGSGKATIAETFTPSGVAGSLLVLSKGNGFAITRAESNVLPGTLLIHVSKDVALNGGTSADTFISDFTQSYVQESIVPEPSTIVLLGCAVPVLGALLARRKKLVLC
jgi:hypothetical protein